MHSRGVKWIGFGWTAFILENLVLSHNREEIIQHFGDSNYHLGYNTLSTLACSSIAYGFVKYRKSEETRLLRKLGKPAIAASFVLQAIGLIGFSQLLPKLQNPVAPDTRIIEKQGPIGTCGNVVFLSLSCIHAHHGFISC